MVPWQGILVFALLGVACTAGAGYRLHKERILRSRGARTLAVVVAHDEHYGVSGGGITARNRSGDPGTPTRRPWAVSTGDPHLVSAPIVEFTTVDGRTVRARSRVSSNTSVAVPGRVMTVYYDPDDPEDVAIVGHGRGVLRVFALIGVLLLITTGLLLVVSEDTLNTAVPVAVPLILGSVFFSIGAYGVGRVWALRRRGTVTEGTVVGETTTSTREGLTLRHPVVRFRTTTGHDIETASERGTLRRRAQPGQSIRLRYHPDDPYRVLLVGDGARPLFWIFALVGLTVLTATVTIATFILTR
ncbi:DUF3592 domain-containing protein [Phytoactinopolyspora halotolerans]|uniref:DUF3592 domain-containing protein n=2 Tax=Phytoactinopolyspora halotolerans TaxID=1981512 RepID=A0A6L9S9F2_9ACTN|nr:DUF3592 domain-containing protein [Phytoactinopolyspora halotolerans]